MRDVPFSVTVQHVPDRELGPLLSRLGGRLRNPVIDHVAADGASDKPAAPARAGPLDLPQDWRLVQDREGESYRWPSGAIAQALPRVHGHNARRRRVQIGLGETIREQVGPRPKVRRGFLSAGSPQQPLVEFVAADDYEQTRELVAVIRGSDGARRMYGVGDAPGRLYRALSNPALQRRVVRAPGTSSSWSLARTTRRRSSTTRSSRAGGATGRRLHAALAASGWRAWGWHRRRAGDDEAERDEAEAMPAGPEPSWKTMMPPKIAARLATTEVSR